MTTFVLFGGTGDLAKRKILPALYSAYSNNRLAADFRLIGVARQSLSEDAFRERVIESITQSFPKLNRKTDAMLDAFLECVHYMKLDASAPGDYAALKQRVDQFAALLHELPRRPDAAHALGELMYAAHDSYNACGLGSAGTDRYLGGGASECSRRRG